MNLTVAMKLRNKLKAALANLQSSLDDVSFSVEISEDVNVPHAVLDGKTYEQALDEVDLVRGELTRLNLAIEDANAVNRAALNELHSLDSAINWSNSMVRKARSFKEKQYEYDNNSVRRAVLYKPITTRNFVRQLEHYRRRKDELEALISKNNGNTEVKFTLDANVNVY